MISVVIGFHFFLLVISQSLRLWSVKGNKSRKPKDQVGLFSVLIKDFNSKHYH